ncbi:hypothetical protein JL722_1224 [Aureococcus anophagefferens]|nr:hypothetical protein JL722_1224 [Aureococcus anophagefferens]
MGGRARLYGAFAVAVAAIACYWELQDPRDHYAALGVSRSATTKEIRAGYKAKALLYHPDKVMSRRFAPWPRAPDPDREAARARSIAKRQAAMNAAARPNPP